MKSPHSLCCRSEIVRVARSTVGVKMWLRSHFPQTHKQLRRRLRPLTLRLCNCAVVRPCTSGGMTAARVWILICTWRDSLNTRSSFLIYVHVSGDKLALMFRFLDIIWEKISGFLHQSAYQSCPSSFLSLTRHKLGACPPVHVLTRRLRSAPQGLLCHRRRCRSSAVRHPGSCRSDGSRHLWHLQEHPMAPV